MALSNGTLKVAGIASSGGTVKSVNGSLPDSTGNVTLNISGGGHPNYSSGVIIDSPYQAPCNGWLIGYGYTNAHGVTSVKINSIVVWETNTDTGSDPQYASFILPVSTGDRFVFTPAIIGTVSFTTKFYKTN